MDFYWIIPGYLAGASIPTTYEDIAMLEEWDIQTVISLEDRVDPNAFEFSSITHYIFSVPDFHPPSQKTIKSCVKIMHESISNGKPVMVHCLAGYGRSGTILAAFLVSCGFSAQEAITHVRRARPGAVEVIPQVNAVSLWEKSLEKR